MAKAAAAGHGTVLSSPYYLNVINQVIICLVFPSIMMT